MMDISVVYHFNTRWYHWIMPTDRRRYQVTETDEVSSALDEAAKRWPTEPRSRLVVRAITAGGAAMATQAATEKRLAAIRRVRGAYTDVYGPDYLQNLRADWPA